MRELKGIYPAIVTAFDDSGAFDPQAMRRIVGHQLEAGVHGFYVCGGTGEGMLLTRDERREVLETVIDEVGGRAGVIAHVGAFQTADTLALAKHAGEAGADAIAALPPAYFYPVDTPALVRYYTDLAGSTDCPLLVYNIPQRTGITMTTELFDQLLEVPNIVGMKDSSGDVYSMGKFLARKKDAVIFSGEDSVLLGGLLTGACGGIGLTYNAMPGLFVALWDAFQAKDMDLAARTQSRLNEIMSAMEGPSGFAGIKQILAWMGLPCGVPRTPMRSFDETETKALRRSLESVRFFDEL